MTVFYPLINQSAWQYNELRYSIRSFVKYTAVDRIIVVGYKPEWLQNVEHIPFEDGPRKEYNIHMKTLAASEVCDEFIQASDDHFVLAPTDFNTHYYSGFLRDKKYENKYQVKVDNTLKAVPNGVFYNIHVPMKMNSAEYKMIMSIYNWSLHELLIKSIYGNFAEGYSQQYMPHDVKVSHFMRRDAIDKFVADKGFLSVSDAGLSVDMKAFLREKFPDKSIYEK